MTTETFVRIAKALAERPEALKSPTACDAAIKVVKNAWEQNGSYGCRRHYVDDAIHACQMRWLELKE